MTFSEYTPTLQPREKLALHGPRSLSDEELLAVMLGSGSKGHSVRMVASHVLPVLDASEDTDVARLQAVRGIGPSKAYLLAAALEFSRRRIKPEGIRIRTARDVVPLINHLLDRPQEHVVSISLSGAHEVIKIRTVSIGLLTSCPIHPREVFVGPITDRAFSVILAHNHPSGESEPSAADKHITQRLTDALALIDVRVLDHIVVGRTPVSFAECGLL
jgi:DNA repair protein RadC